MKILITSLSAGAGHVRAAEAVLTALRRTSSQVDATHIDVADFVSPSFRKIYVDGYRIAVNRAPALWGHFYRYWDTPPDQIALMPLLRRVQRACATTFFAYLHSYRPDLILTTHFLIPQLIMADHSSLRCLHPRVETIITDYDVHNFWISEAVSRYYVGHETMTPLLAQHGISPSRVVASGIPVHPCFSDPADPSTIFQSLQLDPHRPVILVLSGGMGLFELYNAVEHLLKLRQNVQVVTVSGKNAALRGRLEKMKVPENMTLLNLGYVNNMQDLLTISDLVVTKPGGLTVSECLAKKKPMILFSPIPGQEEKNAEFLIAQGAALQAHTLDELPSLAGHALNDPMIRAELLKNIQRCARPQAAYAIAEAVARTSQMAA